MGRELKDDSTRNSDVDPEMIKNLDLLLDYEAVAEEDNWTLLHDLPENALEKNIDEGGDEK